MEPKMVEFLSNAIESEKKKSLQFEVFIKNHYKCLSKEEEFYFSLLKQKKADEEECNEMRKMIEDLRLKAQNYENSISNREKEIEQLESQLAKAKAEHESVLNEELAMSLKNLSTRRKTYTNDKTNDSNLALNIIKQKLNLYKKYLGCTATFEEPNLYVLSFDYNSQQSKACIKFQLNDSKLPTWNILEFEPSDLLNSEDLSDFLDHQDTQKLLSRLMLKKF